MFADEGSMAVLVEMQHTGDPNMQEEVRAVIEHVLADRPGDWRASIMGSQAVTVLQQTGYGGAMDQ